MRNSANGARLGAANCGKGAVEGVGGERGENLRGSNGGSLEARAALRIMIDDRDDYPERKGRAGG